MPNESFQDKTEKATPKRREKAREEGNVARSTEINSAVVLLVGTLTLYIVGSWFLERVQFGMVTLFRESSHLSLSIEKLDHYAMLAIQFVLEILAPVAVMILIFGLASNIVQVGFLFSLKSIQPKLNKLNPLQGFKRLFSLRSIVELIKGIIKITIVGMVAYATIKGDFEEYALLQGSQISVILQFIGKLGFNLVIRIALILFVLAILDYAYQKWEYERNLKMSKQEIKDEYKQAEGDPKVKGRIRALQRQLVINAMIQELPDADVVITNPTHLAVALKFDGDSMSSPKVVAKGARKMAERIKAIAAENNIPIVENKELARAIYKTVDVGMEIPAKFYQAVAEVLSYVYRLKNKRFD